LTWILDLSTEINNNAFVQQNPSCHFETADESGGHGNSNSNGQKAKATVVSQLEKEGIDRAVVDDQHEKGTAGNGFDDVDFSDFFDFDTAAGRDWI
jgi:hypothetical protein